MQTINSDIHKILGANLKYLRTNTFKECKNKKDKLVMKPLTQMQLAKFLNVTFQQIQKYENSINGLDAIKIYKLSIFFGIPMEYFFDEKLSLKQKYAKLITQNDEQYFV